MFYSWLSIGIAIHVANKEAFKKFLDPGCNRLLLGPRLPSKNLTYDADPEFLDPRHKPDRHQNLTDWSFSRTPALQKSFVTFF